MNTITDPRPTSAFSALATGGYRASALTRGPWNPEHQHAGPPIALVCREIERAASAHGLSHMARLTANLLRPIPIGELAVEVAEDYVGRNAGHFSAKLLAAGKEVARFTALAQRENEVALPPALPGHPTAFLGTGPDQSPLDYFPFASTSRVGYADLVETRAAYGHMFKGPCNIWFRLRHPLVEGEMPSPYQRVAVAADSGNGISAVLDYQRYIFVNSDLTINLLRRPQGEWICLEARSHFGPNGCGLAESRLFDSIGLVGISTQSLALRMVG
jgi:Thioesterase-like superfamily